LKLNVFKGIYALLVDLMGRFGLYMICHGRATGNATHCFGGIFFILIPTSCIA